MNSRNRIIYLLVKHAKKSKKEAILALAAGQVRLNNQVCYENELVGHYDSLFINDICLINGQRFVYHKFYKPVGIECTLQRSIPNSLAHFLNLEFSELFYLGRLDKNSEGLIILTNDGHICNKVIHPQKQIKKEYIVKLESNINHEFKEKMENGVSILGTQTLPCELEIIDKITCKITLIQGLNRQIRRMCFELGNYVVALKRVSIGEIRLNHLKPGEIMPLDRTEIEWLRNLT